MKNNTLKILMISLVCIMSCLMGAGINIITFASSMPVVDYQDTIKLDDFNFNQALIYQDKENKESESLLEKSKIKYRISTHNNNKLAVEDGKLVIKAEELTDDYIDFETQADYDIFNKTYMVIKMLTNYEATLEDLSISIDLQNYVNFDDLKISNKERAVLLNQENPYYEELTGYYYVVVNCVESELCSLDSNMNTLGLKYQGKGRIYIDEIFYTNELESEIKESLELKETFNLTTERVNESFASFSNDFKNNQYNRLTITISLNEDNRDINSLILEIDNQKFSFTETDEYRQIILTDNIKIEGINFSENKTQTLTFDLEKMGINKARNFRFYADSSKTGVLDLYDIKFEKVLTFRSNYLENESLISESLTDIKEMNEDSNDLGKIDLTNIDLYNYSVVAFDIEGKNITPSNITCKSLNENLEVKFLNGYFNETDVLNNFETYTCYILLQDLDLDELKINGIDLIYSLNDFGKLGVKNVRLANLMNKYKYVQEKFTVYELIDNVAPQVYIYNSPHFEINNLSNKLVVDFTPDENGDGDVKTVVITLTDSKGRIQTGDLDNYTFTVYEGLYSLTITVTDYNGNTDEESMNIMVVRGKDVVITGPTNPDENEEDENNKSKINIGKILLIVGIVIASLVVIAGIVVLVIFIIKKRQNSGTLKFR